MANAAAQELPLTAAAKAQKFALVQSLLRQRGVDVNAAEKDGTTALHWAVHWNHLETVEVLLRVGAKPNVSTDYGVTPLMLAAMNGSGAVTAPLLKAGADVHVTLSTGETPLMWAARTGDAETVRLLLAHGSSVEARENVRGQTALMWAAARNHAEVIRLLTNRRTDVHARSARGFTAFLFAAREGALEAMRELRTAGARSDDVLPNKASALLVAAASSRTAVVRWLLEQGADPNVGDEVGMRPLHAAFFRQRADPDLVKVLLAHGADPNARMEGRPETLPSEIGSYAILVGATPFLMAARNFDVDMMRVLLARGADPKATTKAGMTALMFAAGMGRFLTDGARHTPEMVVAVRAAIDLGIDVNAAAENGQTALHAAANAGADAVIELLAAKGAVLHATDRNGRSARNLAELAVRDGVSQATVDLLRKLGG